MEKAVRDWIEANFHLNAIRVEDFPLLPAGRLITDRAGQSMVVYWDIARERVAMILPN